MLRSGWRRFSRAGRNRRKLAIYEIPIILEIGKNMHRFSRYAYEQEILIIDETKRSTAMKAKENKKTGLLQ